MNLDAIDEYINTKKQICKKWDKYISRADCVVVGIKSPVFHQERGIRYFKTVNTIQVKVS